jgi:hypothetical protein
LSKSCFQLHGIGPHRSSSSSVQTLEWVTAAPSVPAAEVTAAVAVATGSTASTLVLLSASRDATVKLTQVALASATRACKGRVKFSGRRDTRSLFFMFGLSLLFVSPQFFNDTLVQIRVLQQQPSRARQSTRFCSTASQFSRHKCQRAVARCTVLATGVRPPAATRWNCLPRRFRTIKCPLHLVICCRHADK